jgi:SSS family solute:Na+ symporter
MVSGLTIPLLGGLFWKGSHWVGAITAMLSGGAVTAGLQWFKVSISPNIEREKLIEQFDNLRQYLPIPDVSIEGMRKFEITEVVNAAQLIHIPLGDIHFYLPLGLDPNVFGIATSAVFFFGLSWILKKREELK